MSNKNNQKISWWQPGIVLFVQLSAWIGGPVIIAIIIGKYLDKKFHSDPWLFLLSVGISFFISIAMIVRIGLNEMNISEDSEKDNK